MLASAALFGAGACSSQQKNPLVRYCDPFKIVSEGQIRAQEILFVQDGANIRHKPTAAFQDPSDDTKIGKVSLSSPSECVVVIPEKSEKIALSRDDQGLWYGVSVGSYALSGIELNSDAKKAWVNQQRATKMCYQLPSDMYKPCEK